MELLAVNPGSLKAGKGLSCRTQIRRFKEKTTQKKIHFFFKQWWFIL